MSGLIEYVYACNDYHVDADKSNAMKAINGREKVAFLSLHGEICGQKLYAVFILSDEKISDRGLEPFPRH